MYSIFCTIMISPHTLATFPVIPISVKDITIHPIAKANTPEINLYFSLSITLPSSNPSESPIVFHHITPPSSIQISILCCQEYYNCLLPTSLSTSTCPHPVSIHYTQSQKLFISFPSMVSFLKCKSSHAIPLLKTIQWHPIKAIIRFRSFMIASKVLSEVAYAYLLYLFLYTLYLF